MSIGLLALDWSNLLWWIDVIVKVSIGLGAVIFVHELGHFLVAKACGVKIEKFMIGFDIGGYKLSWRRGETIYGIGILPLGGYVKMFGQDDDPAHIAEQMQKSQVNAASADAVPITGPSGETYYIDRRSYLAKSVPQRMAIISAGVVMNVIFAFIFAVIAYGMGVPYTPAIVSQTVPGSPAWQAGIESGDEIVQIGERGDPTFMQLVGGVTLGDLEQGIPTLVRRASDGDIVAITLRPTQVAGKLATVGIAPPVDLTLSDEPTVGHSAASQAKFVGGATDSTNGQLKLQGGDRIVRVDDVPVKNYRKLSAELARNADKTLRITVRRPGKEAVEDPDAGVAVHPDEAQELVFEVPPQPLWQLGLVMEIGPITAVQADSPAAKAGLAAGDVIELIDGRASAESIEDGDGWTPFTLPDYLRRAALAGREVELAVRRGASEKSEAKALTIRVTPSVPKAIQSGIPPGAPIATDTIGIAYRIENRVQSVAPGGPAASTGIAAGDEITEATITRPADDDGERFKPLTMELGPDSPNWPAVVDAVQFAPSGTKVELTVRRPGASEARTVTVLPQPADGVFIPPRGFSLEPLMRTRSAATFAEQVRYGFDETVDALTMVFRFLQKLGTQVPITMLGGPGTIAVAAGVHASEGLSSLLVFLTMLSANLAVLNFLPIPLLDGGHMVFLAYEGIRGRPASERFVLALHTAGFVFIIGLMVFVIGLDIQRWLLT